MQVGINVQEVQSLKRNWIFTVIYKKYHVFPNQIKLKQVESIITNTYVNIVLLNKIAFFPHILSCLLKFSAFIFIENYNRVGWNKRVGRIFLENLIIMQSLIRACRKEKTEKFNKRAARLFGTLEQSFTEVHMWQECTFN